MSCRHDSSLDLQRRVTAYDIGGGQVSRQHDRRTSCVAGIALRHRRVRVDLRRARQTASSRSRAGPGYASITRLPEPRRWRRHHCVPRL